LIKKFGIDHTVIDADGLGAGPFDTLSKGHQMDAITGFRNIKLDHKEFCNKRTLAAYSLKDLLAKGHIAIGDDKLISELLKIKYSFDASQRRILVSKDQMKKLGVKSPNRADSCFYAVSALEEIRTEQERPYRGGAWNMPRYAEDGDLFKIAGV
jgi:hypothetical protein